MNLRNVKVKWSARTLLFVLENCAEPEIGGAEKQQMKSAVTTMGEMSSLTSLLLRHMC